VDSLIPDIGVFAGERIEAGTFLGIYSGELITEAIGDSRKYVFTELSGAFIDNKRRPDYTTNTGEHISLTFEGITTLWMPSTSEMCVL